MLSEKKNYAHVSEDDMVFTYALKNEIPLYWLTIISIIMFKTNWFSLHEIPLPIFLLTVFEH